MKWYYSFSGKSKKIQLIVPGVDVHVASGITPGYPRMPGCLKHRIFLGLKDVHYSVGLHHTDQIEIACQPDVLLNDDDFDDNNGTTKKPEGGITSGSTLLCSL